jgi:hypothetical protein
VGHTHSHATAEGWENRLVRISPSYGAHDYKYSAMDNYAFGMSPMDLHGISNSVRDVGEESSRHTATIGSHGSESTQDDNILDHDNISGSSPESGHSPHRGHYDEDGIETEGGDPSHPYTSNGHPPGHPRFSIVSNHLPTPNHLPKSHNRHYELVVEDEKEDHKYWDVSGSRLSQWCLIRPQELLIFLFLVGLVGIVILLIYLVFLTPGTPKTDPRYPKMPSDNNSTKPYYRLQIGDRSQWLGGVDLTEEVFGRRSKSRG